MKLRICLATCCLHTGFLDETIEGAKIQEPRVSGTFPISGFRPEMGKKRPKNGFWPHRKNGRKMAEKWENWPKNGSKCQISHVSAIFLRPKMGQKCQISHFSAIFLPFSRWAKIHFSAVFFPFRAGNPKWEKYQTFRIATLDLRIQNVMEGNDQIPSNAA